MTRYGIADVGSNTIVLIIYEIRDGRPVQKYYESAPAHLIDDVHEGVMSEEGIRKAHETLTHYARILNKWNTELRWADITEPCRIANRDALVSSLEQTGFSIWPLNGTEEAAYDYIGSRLSWDPDEGAAFDVGGGSTELISFRDGQVIDAMSFHLGCVRLAHESLDTDSCEREILKARSQYPSLDISSRRLIGIGGTVRAAALLASRLFGTDTVVPVSCFRKIFDRIRVNDTDYVRMFRQTVDPARQPVFLSGLHMILEIARIFEAEDILISATGIREGFLLARAAEAGYLPD